MNAHVDKNDLLYLDELMGKAEFYGVKHANNMVQHIAIVFGRSAKKHTGPDKSSSLRAMGKKYRVRRVVKLPLNKQQSLGQFWYKNKQTNTIFSTKKELKIFGSKHKESNDIVPVYRAIKAWNKKKRKYVYHGTTLTLGLKEGVKRSKGIAPIGTNIPNSGAAKAGWIVMLKKLGDKRSNSMGRHSMRLGRFSRKYGNDPVIKHTNNVDYVDKISPNIISQSMRNAVKHFKFNEKRVFDRMVKSEFRRSKSQLLKTVNSL